MNKPDARALVAKDAVGWQEVSLDVLREMHRLGMGVDIAHLTLAGVRQAVEVTRKPLRLSHTVLQTNFARSISAEHAPLVAKTGGVIGIFPVNSGGYYGFSGYVEHIIRMIKVAGVDHVGLGSDFDGITSVPRQLEDVSMYPNITQGLLDRGYGDEDIQKILGGNLLRVLRGAEETAAELKQKSGSSYQTLREILTRKCPVCEGDGFIVSEESRAIEIEPFTSWNTSGVCGTSSSRSSRSSSVSVVPLFPSPRALNSIVGRIAGGLGAR